jgi:hypothetical protein
MKARTSKFIIGLSGIIIGMLFILYPSPSERILNIQNYLITVGGIISAFVIAYLSSKIFNLRSERAIRQIEIDNFSDKLTLFRRLLCYVMKSPNLWNRYDDVTKFRVKYPGLTYEQLHNQSDEPNELTAKFWLNEDELSQNTIDLFLAMQCISVSADADPEAMTTWNIDKAARFNYSLEQLSKYFEPCNRIWYCLSYRYDKYGKDSFKDTGILIVYENEVRDIIRRLNRKFEGQDFHRKILTEIAYEFYEYNLPRLYELTSQNVGIPKTLTKTFNTLFFIMGFGVLMPLILQSLNVNDCTNITLTLIFVLLTSLRLLKFMFDFYQFLNEEVHLKIELNDS